MTRPDLPPIEFVLTPNERAQAAIVACRLEHNRREQNARDAQRREPARRPER